MENNKSKTNTVLLAILIILALGIVWFQWNGRKAEEGNSVDIKEQEIVKTENNVTKSENNSQNTCNTNYSTTEESRVVSETSATLLTSFEKKCDNHYYITLDYLTPGNDDPNDNIGFFENSNPKLRTFKVSTNVQVKLNDESIISFNDFIKSLKKHEEGTFNQSNVYMGSRPLSSPAFNVKIENGVVVSLDEVFLP